MARDEPAAATSPTEEQLGMSLVTQFRGDIKNGKTESAVFWVKRLSGDIGIPVFSNMESLQYENEPWAIPITLEDMMLDMRVKDASEAYIKCGILFIDEAHVYWDTNLMRGARGIALTHMIAQCGKRGLVIVYTSHLTGMVAPRVRELTQMQIKCRTENEGRTVLWNVRDPRDWREAADNNMPPPPDNLLVLHDGYRQFKWYDTDEFIDPFAGMTAAGSSKSSKSFVKELKSLTPVHEVRPVKGSVTREIATEAQAVRKQVEYELGRQAQGIDALRSRR